MEVQRRFDQAVQVRFERTSVDDVGFGMRQLTDVAAKALSPGVNDPTTATHALGHASALLCTLAKLPLGNELVRDDEANVRVIVQPPTFSDLLWLAIDEPRRYGASEPQVAERIFRLLDEVAWVARTGTQRHALGTELERLRVAVAAQRPDEVQRHRYEKLYYRVREALTD